MEKKTDIVICLGSSCFSRGNRKSLPLISEYLKEKKLEEQVFFHGHRCFGHCEKGPIIKIGEEEKEHVQPESIRDTLDKLLRK
jgi:NADH:ubiquinone oxidoreductase subunit E